METSSTGLLFCYVSQAMDTFYKPGCNLHKTGMAVMGIVAQTQMQSAIYVVGDKTGNKAVMNALDGETAYVERDTVRFAALGYSETWKLKMGHLSKCYLTRLDQAITIRDYCTLLHY